MGRAMTYATGCDISHWQDKPSTPERVDFNVMRGAGVSFVFLKASQSTWTDSTFGYHWKTSKEAGLLRGAYHFLVFTGSAKAQARHFFSLLEDDPGELPMVCDYEWWTPLPANSDDWLWSFLCTLESLSGKVPMIYSGAYFLEAHGVNEHGWTKYPLWVASYSNQAYMEKNVTKRTPWDTWDFWQYTDKGDGLAHGVESYGIDMNYYNGTEEELRAKYGGLGTAPSTLR